MGEVLKGDVGAEGRVTNDLGYNLCQFAPCFLWVAAVGSLSYLSDLIMKPFGASLAVDVAVESIIVATQMLQGIM